MVFFWEVIYISNIYDFLAKPFADSEAAKEILTVRNTAELESKGFIVKFSYYFGT